MNFHGFNLSQAQIDQLSRFEEILITRNKEFNLTAITKHEEVWIKHFYDSLLFLKAMDLSDKKIIDVGTGAGFPGIVLLIYNSCLDITFNDSNNKKINFIDSAIKQIFPMQNINYHTSNQRAESFSPRLSFDIALTRALAPLHILLELCYPLVKVGGYVIGVKGQGYIQELEKAQNIIKLLDYQLVDIIKEELPDDYGFRAILVFKKNSDNKKYPRPYHLIKKG
jgi:16S rRNA (guanine527-N7)-methyltransferase